MNRLRSVEHWDRGFESYSRHECLCAFILCVGSDLATGWSPFQGVLPTVIRLINWSETKRFTDALRSKVGATGKKERFPSIYKLQDQESVHYTRRKLYTYWLDGHHLSSYFLSGLWSLNYALPLALGLVSVCIVVTFVWTPTGGLSRLWFWCPEIRTCSINWAQLCRFLLEDGDRIQSPKYYF
jgi:hypothetical protein